MGFLALVEDFAGDVVLSLLDCSKTSVEKCKMQLLQKQDQEHGEEF